MSAWRRSASLRSTLLAAALGTLATRPAAGQASGTGTITVFAAASLTDAFQELGRILEHGPSGTTVRLSFAGSQQLALQLESGAGADVFASADQRWMTYAQNHGLIDGTPAIFARNRLVVIVPRTNPGRIRALPDLARKGLKVVLAAEAVPAGRYSREALHKMAAAPGYGAGFDTRVLGNVVSQEDNVKAVVAKVQLGEADGGIVYRSDLTAAVRRYVHAIDIPDDYNVIAGYPIAVVTGGSNPAGARSFLALVLSEEGQRVLRRHGLIAAAGETPAAAPVPESEPTAR